MRDDDETQIGEAVMDSADEEDEEEEEQQQQQQQQRRQQAAQNTHGRKRGRAAEPEEEGGEGMEDEDGDEDDNMTDDGSANGHDRLRASLDKMPGWRAMIMGAGIKALPAAFETGLPGHWIQWTDTGQPFPKGAEPIPARTLCMCAGKDIFEHDAQRLGDFATHADRTKRALSVATAALWGMFTTGTSKGWTCSPNHTELNTAKVKDMEGEELDKFKKKLQGNINTYTYQPNAKSRSRSAKTRPRSLAGAWRGSTTT